MKHPYAKILTAIANGEEIQRKMHDHWVNADSYDELRHIAAELHLPECYRVKPKTIRIGAYDVPEPVREPLNVGDIYWETNVDKVIDYEWINDEAEKVCLNQGLIHKTREAAELHRNALLSFTERVKA